MWKVVALCRNLLAVVMDLGFCLVIGACQLHLVVGGLPGFVDLAASHPASGMKKRF
jgi:hypothetical protein